MSSKPLVSIVTPSYNQGAFLQETIESVLDQDYPRIEYIVMDGGSTDNSVEVIRQHEGRIAYWQSQKDGGQADAIKRGWQRARGEILAYLNSDDLYAPGAISAVVETFNLYPETDVVAGDCTIIDEQGRFVRAAPSGKFTEHHLSGNSLPQQGVFCRRTAVEEAGGIDASLHYIMDWEFWLRLWLAGAEFRHLPRVVAHFRIWGQSKTTVSPMKFAKERAIVYGRMLEQNSPHDDEQWRREVSNLRAGNLLEIALLYQLEGNERDAERYLREAIAVRERSKDLPHPEAMGLTLAAMQEGWQKAIETFAASLAKACRESGLPARPEQWERTLTAETQLVRAWNAQYAQDARGAAKHFARAILAEPRRALQRRTLSPALKAFFKMVRSAGTTDE